MPPELRIGIEVMLTFFVLAYVIAKYAGDDADAD